MANRARVLVDNDHLRVVYMRRDGKRKPARVNLMLPPLPGTNDSRYISLTIDELFDITEVFDDLCDHIEDTKDS